MNSVDVGACACAVSNRVQPNAYIANPSYLPGQTCSKTGGIFSEIEIRTTAEVRLESRMNEEPSRFQF
jgi:hypothetical protein